MSKDESMNMTNRELTRHLINVAEQMKVDMAEHRKESSVFRENTTAQLSKINTSIAVIQTENKSFKEKQEDHTKRVVGLEKGHNWAKGFIGALTLIGLGGIVEYFRNPK